MHSASVGPPPQLPGTASLFALPPPLQHQSKSHAAHITVAPPVHFPHQVCFSSLQPFRFVANVLAVVANVCWVVANDVYTFRNTLPTECRVFPLYHVGLSLGNNSKYSCFCLHTCPQVALGVFLTAVIGSSWYHSDWWYPSFRMSLLFGGHQVSPQSEEFDKQKGMNMTNSSAC